MKYPFIALLVLSNLAQASVSMPEASVLSGYGSERRGWSVSYSGACGERVGLRLGYIGRGDITAMVSEIEKFARSTAPKLQKRCPSVETIHVETWGKSAAPPRVYLFKMHRDKNWQVSDSHWSADLISSLTDKGYRPFKLPTYRHGLLRLADGAFEAYYGRLFDGYMRGTQFDRHMQEGTKPPRPSHFTITGQWYEFGSEGEGEHCDTTLNGYPYWGSFVLTLGVGATTAYVQKKSCASPEAKGKSARLHLTTPSPSDFKRSWKLDHQRVIANLGKQLAAMNMQSQQHDRTAYASSREALFKSPNLNIYPRRENWCQRRELDAVYTVKHTERDPAFNGNYANHLGKIARDLVVQYCGDPLTVGVANYAKGDPEHWDRMSFLLQRPNKTGFEPKDEAYLELSDHHLGQRAQAHLAHLDANHLGPACSDAPFCELPGGRYLNAIYRGDAAMVREIDELHKSEVRSSIDKSMGNWGMQGQNPISQLMHRIADKDFTFVESAANKYMYAYSVWPSKCQKPGAMKKTFKHTTPVVINTDEWGVTTREGGETYTATYTTNPEFFELRDRLGSHYGAQRSDNPLLQKSTQLVFKGLVSMKTDYDCRGPLVSQFEHNLIALAKARGIGVKPANLRSEKNPKPLVKSATKPVAKVAAPPKSYPATRPRAPAVAKQPRGRSPQRATDRTASAPKSTNRGTRASAAKDQAEAYKQRNAKMMTLNDAFASEVTAMSETLKVELKSATSNKERMEIMRKFQQQMAQMREQNNLKTQEIRNSYQ